MDFMRLILFICLALFISNSFAQRITVLTEELPPYQYKDELGDATGYGVALMKAILEQANINANISVVPWARGYNQALKRKNVVLFSMVRTPEREDLFKWIGEVDQLHYFLYKLSARKDLSAKSIEEARNYRIGVTRVSFEHDTLVNLGFSRLTTGIKYAQLIDMLNANRFDFLFASQGPLEEVLKETGYAVDSVETDLHFEEIDQKLYIALSKKSDEALAIKLRNAYQTVASKGIKSQLKLHWLGKNSP